MSQQTESAKTTTVSSLDRSVVGRKVRIAGRLLAYDPVTAIILVVDNQHGVLVDVSLCIDQWSGSWIREHLGTVMVVGQLDSASEAIAIPTIPAYALAPDVDTGIVLRALLVTHAGDLDLELWNSAIQERDESRQAG